jgi:hypothetical protein
VRALSYVIYRSSQREIALRFHGSAKWTLGCIALIGLVVLSIVALRSNGSADSWRTEYGPVYMSPDATKIAAIAVRMSATRRNRRTLVVATWIGDDPRLVTPPAGWPYLLNWIQVFAWDAVSIDEIQWTSNDNLLVIGHATHGDIPYNTLLQSPHVEVTFEAQEK